MLAWVVIDRRHLRQSPQSRFIRALPLPASLLNFQLLTFNLPLFNVATFQPSNLPTCKPSKSFRCNTYGSPRKCCKQKTYGLAKPFRCNTYKKTGGPILQAKRSSPCPTLPPFGDSDLRTFQRAKRLDAFPAYFPSSVRSSKFRIPQPLCLPLLRKLPGCTQTIPIPELATRQSPLAIPPAGSILWVAI